MRIKPASIIITITVLLIGLSLVFAMGRKPDQEDSPAKREPAEEFSLSDLYGNAVSLSDFKGKVVFLNFWAERCPACRSQMPSVQALHEKLKGKDFQVISVNLNEDPQDVKEYIEGNGYSFRVLLDRQNIVARRYSVVYIPTTFIIDKNGYIVAQVVGARNWTDGPIIQEIKRLIEE